jgi:hypothetical protein
MRAIPYGPGVWRNKRIGRLPLDARLFWCFFTAMTAQPDGGPFPMPDPQLISDWFNRGPARLSRNRSAANSPWPNVFAWPHEKIHQMDPGVRLEYFWLRPLGLDGRPWNCAPEIVWRTCYERNRVGGTPAEKISVRDVEFVLDELARVQLIERSSGADGMKARWLDGLEPLLPDEAAGPLGARRGPTPRSAVVGRTMAFRRRGPTNDTGERRCHHV